MRPYNFLSWERDTDDDDQSNILDLIGEEQQDRPYTREVIQKMFNAALDIRVKIIISLLSSSGIRHGVLPDLRFKDIEKMINTTIIK
jgi:integrase